MIILREKDVERSAADYLNKQNYLVEQQFETGETRIDVAAFKWLSDYEIDAIGVECKATTNPKAIMKILMEQIFIYQKYFPRVYLAIPEGGNYSAIRTICKSSNVGYMTVNSNGKANIELEASNLNPVFRDSFFRSEVLSRAIMLFVFKKNFGNNVIFSSRGGWISTKGDVQFNMVKNSQCAEFGVNVEDTRKILKNVSDKDLYSVLKNKTPKDANIWFAKEKYFGRGFRTSLTLIYKNIKDIIPKDATCIIDTTKSGSTNLHLEVYIKVWEKGEKLDKKSYFERIRKAKDELSPLYDLLRAS